MRRALSRLPASALLFLGLLLARLASAGEPPLRVEGLSEQHSLLVKTSSPELAHLLRIHATKPGEHTVCILAEALLHAQGTAVLFAQPTGKLCMPLQAGEPVVVPIRAPLDSAGVYTGKLHLSILTEELVVPLTVERAAPRLPVFEAKPPTLAMLYPFVGGQVQIPLVRTESGTAGDVPLGVQVSLSRKGVGGSPGELVVSAIHPSIDLSKQTTVTIGTVPGPGEYQGKLWVTTSDKQLAPHAFTVLAKAPAWIAFLCIFAGSLLALLLRWLVGKVSPQLLVTRRLAVVQAALSSQSDGPAWLSPIRSRLVSELNHLQDEFRAGLGNTLTVAALEEKLRLVSQLQTAHVRNEQVGGAVTWPEGSRLLTVAAEALEGSTSERAQLDAAQSALTDFYKQFPDNVREGLTKQCDGLRELLSHIPKEETVANKLAERSEVERLLSDARVRITAGQLPTAYRILSRASLRIAVYGVEKLLSEPEPAGASESELAEWKLIREVGTPLRSKLQRAQESSDGSLGQEDAEAFRDLFLREQTLLQRIANRTRPHAGGVMSAAVESREAPPDASEAAPVALTGLAGLIPSAPGSSLPTLSIIDGWRAWTDRGIALAAMLVSCTTGLLVLWVDDPTWGDLKSMITAFLWGLGLHQVAGIALGSITEIQGKLLSQR